MSYDEASRMEFLDISISTRSRESTSVSVAATAGSYKIVNNTLVIAVKLTDDPPILHELLAPATTSDMVTLLTVDEIKPPSEQAYIPSSDQIEDIIRDDEYYLYMINFEFEDVQFFVPQWRFPAGSTLNLPTDKETCTITWDYVSAQDFRCLLKFMYPLDSLPLPPSHWVPVLKLSVMWYMCDYRKEAILRHRSFHLESEEKIALGQLAGVPDWYREGCIELACGKSQLDASHEATIGIDAMVKIARARDAAYRDTVVQFPDLASFAHEVPDSSIAEDNPSATGSSIIDNICTARANGLSSLLRCCYERLIHREESITLEEVATLGLETTIGIWKARLRLLQEYRHILKSTEELDFATHIEAEFATELAEAQQLQNIFDPAPSMAITSRSISMQMDDFFDPRSLYVLINLKFNTCLDIALTNVIGWQYDGAASQTWRFERTDPFYKIVNASNHLYLSESKYFNHCLACSEEPDTFFVGRASAEDELPTYGIFLSQLPEPTTTAVRLKAARDCVSLDSWDDGQREESKWKIVTVGEAKKHFGVA